MAEFRDDDEDEDEPRWTDLQLAAEEGDLVRVQALLASGREDVNAPPSGYYGRTALQAACLGGYRDVVLALLDAGADVNAPGGNNSMRTALQLACGANCENDEDNDSEDIEAIVGLLLAAGARINASACRYNGRTALQAAAETKRRNIVALLLRLGAEVNAPPSTTAGLTALQAACFNKYPDPLDPLLVQDLLDAGADANAVACRHKGFTALQAACLASNSLPVVDMLLAAGADPDAPGSGYRGGTALHAAAHMGHADIVRRLLASGANVNVVAGPVHQTPLQSAIVNDQLECVGILKEAGGIMNSSRARFLFDF